MTASAKKIHLQDRIRKAREAIAALRKQQEESLSLQRESLARMRAMMEAAQSRGSDGR